MNVVSGNWESSSVAVIALAGGQWRVLRDDGNEHDLPPLLGFVRIIGDLYETTAVGEPLTRRYWRDLESAVSSLRTDIPRAAQPARLPVPTEGSRQTSERAIA